MSTVRAAVGVSNADATRYLKEWAEEITRVEAQRGALERQLAVISKQLKDPREAERAAAQEAADAARRLATAEARAATLEQVHTALLQRVSPEPKGPGQ